MRIAKIYFATYGKGAAQSKTLFFSIWSRGCCFCHSVFTHLLDLIRSDRWNRILMADDDIHTKEQCIIPPLWEIDVSYERSKTC